MKIKNQIFLSFLAVGLSIALVSSLILHQVEKDLNDLAEISFAHQTHIPIALMAVALSLIIGNWLAQRITRPLTRLTDASIDLAHGGFEKRIEIETTDELGTVATAFNLMVDKLKESLEKYRTLYDGSSDAIMILGDTGFIDCNPATLRLFGIANKEEFCQLLPEQLSPPCQPNGVDSLTAANERIAEAYRHGSNSFEWIHRRGNGEDFFALVLLTALTLAGKEVLQATVRDISRRKAAEEQILELNRQLSQKVTKLEEALLLAAAGIKARSEFLANTTHELVTPLNTIIGFSQVLLDNLGGPLTEKQREYLQAILQSGIRLNETYGEILQVASLSSGGMALQLEQIPLKSLLETALFPFRQKIRLQGLTLTLEKTLPLETEIDGDRDKLLQVLFTLLDNAVKFTPPGGSVSVTVQRVNDDDFIEISVRDTGIGIKAEDLSRLFQPFQQLEEAATKRYSGTGLGLYLTKKLIELHSGTIRVESTFGEGSRFTVTLPLQQK